MAEEKELDVSRYEFSVAYDGAARVDDHSIQVESLAPALLAFGKLIREANAEFNGKKATAKVLVVSDFEHKCFQINFETVVGIYQQVKTFLGVDDVKTAKDILEWLGLLGKLSGGIAAKKGLSYFEYLKWKRGRKVTEKKPLADKDQSGLVEVHVEGDNNSVHVHNHIVNLSENPKALRATRDAFIPLGSDGFDRVQLKSDTELLEKIEAPEVEDIVASCNLGIEEAKETEPEVEVTPAWLNVYSPVYDTAAPKWRFRLGREVIYADISQTSIAQDAMARGGALADDTYQVKLEVTTEVDAQGKKKEPTYKVVEVIRFIAATPPPQQTQML